MTVPRPSEKASTATPPDGGRDRKTGFEKTQQIPEGTTILTPVSVVHSHKKGGWKL